MQVDGIEMERLLAFYSILLNLLEKKKVKVFCKSWYRTLENDLVR